MPTVQSTAGIPYSVSAVFSLRFGDMLVDTPFMAFVSAMRPNMAAFSRSMRWRSASSMSSIIRYP